MKKIKNIGLAMTLCICGSVFATPTQGPDGSITCSNGPCVVKITPSGTVVCDNDGCWLFPFREFQGI